MPIPTLFRLMTGVCLLVRLSWPAVNNYPVIRFGPYVLNEIHLMGSPTNNRDILPNGGYRLQFGWIEPITIDGLSHAACTFLETDAHFDVTPYQTDLGTTFSLKPFRLLEIGLTYNRLIFNSSMVGFQGQENGTIPPTQDWRSYSVLTRQPGEAVGADIFTFTGGLFLHISRVSAYLGASRSLWDVDLHDQDYLFEFQNDLLIKRRDRINIITLQIQNEIPAWTWLKPFTMEGFFLRNRYWYTTQTKLEKNLISAGILGLRYGTNPYNQKRGLDLGFGYFSLSPQLERSVWWRRATISLDWKWSVDILNAQEI